MLNKASVRVLQALSNLEGHADFEVLREWMAQSLDTIRRDTDTTRDEVLTRWNQGASQALEQFLVAASSAKEALRRGK